jgi:hypothetical protein
MISTSTHLGFLPLIAAGLFGCAPPPSNSVPNRVSAAIVLSPECYSLAYSDPVGEVPANLFPVWVKLFPGSDSGHVAGRPPPGFDPLGWPSFTTYTWWKKLPLDSIEVNFSGNSEAIIIHVQRIGSGVVGRARYLSDIENGSRPSMRVHGTREVCPGRVSPAA